MSASIAISPDRTAFGRDEGIYLLDDAAGQWSAGSAEKALLSHAALLDACGQMLDASEKRGYEAGQREGFRRAVALIPQIVDELLSGRDLGDLPPSAVRWLATIIAGRLADRRPPEPLGPTVVEGGLGI